MGWERSVLGYPTTDETTTPDGIGRFNHFAGTGGASIYWTPNTGAHEVYGVIRQLWSELGWERSPLGYPTSGEKDTEFHAARVNHFERGDIYFDGHRGAYEVFPRPDFVPGDPTVVGKWVVPDFNAGIDGLHAALLHTNALWFLSYREPADPANPGPVPTPFGDSAVLDLQTHTTSTPTYQGRNGQTELPNVFCGAHAFLPDGRLLIVGGDREDQSRVRAVHLFTPGGPGGGQWQYLGDMAAGRWYPSTVTLPDGRMLSIGGEKRLPDPIATRNTTYEIFDPTTGHIGQPVEAPPLKGFGAAITYPFVFVLPGNKLFIHGGTRTVFLDLTTMTFEPTELDAVARPGRNSRTYGDEGTSVVLPLLPDASPPYRARVMLIGGGGAPPAGIRTPATATTEILDLGATPLGWALAAPMRNPRVMPDAVLLPDGTTLVMNGSSAGSADNGANPVWEAERYNPVTGTWTTMAPALVPRLYHATALLLPDATVLTAGTDSMWNPDPFHHGELRLEIFSPPYLFQGPRPTITAAPAQMSYATTAIVQTPDAASITTVALMRCGSTTHSFNSDQRHVGLGITQRGATDITLTTPPDRAIAPPGYYLLFVLRNGVPSMAKFVRLG